MIKSALVATAVFGWVVIAATAQPAMPSATQPAKLLIAPDITVEQVVQKNVAARGGLEAWRRIETMAWKGRVESGTRATPPMPFVMDLQRPNKTRFEVSTIDKRFARIFDGTHGWRVRPGSSGAPEIKAFTKEEAAYARDEFVIDGPLIDYASKGITLKLAGIDEMEGHKAYLLELQSASGAIRRVWIDTETFLEIRSDRPATNPLIKGAPISVYYRDYRTIEGLQIATTIEMRSSATSPPQRLVIEKVALNPEFPAQVFAKPATPWQRRALVRVGGDDPQGKGAGRPGP
jgi:hypothetical protein